MGNKEGDLVDEESESDVEDDDNETMSFMASKISKGTSSSRSGDGTERKRDEVSFYTLFQALGWLLEEIHVT
ncbi:hypothetical protein Tco_1228646 [Tanacetum coccineum]